MRFAGIVLLLVPSVGLADSTRLCGQDQNLSLAAGKLVVEDRVPEFQVLSRAVRDAGSDAVAVRGLWLSTGEDDELGPWLERMRQSADAPLICGEAAGKGGRLVIATAQGGSLAPLDPGSTHIRGWLAPSFQKPQIVVSDAGGQLRRLPVDRVSLRRGVPIPGDLMQPLRIQLVAQGPAGPRPVAERFFPPAGIEEYEPAAGDSERTGNPSRAVTAVQLNQIRRARGVSPVRENQLLARLAARHAQAICDQGRIVHELEPGDDPESRLARAGVSARLIGETVARAADPVAAFEAMQRSPSHLLTLIDHRFTDGGLGTAKDGNGNTCAVVVLAAWPRYVGL